ncbi:conserved hypothetical protein [Theileria orientalis strain Shintoku]|uniref:Uncharacterized protein n=1 Tax=Theileria orientalis strain Shintoku TaxID=869250 RepID=J4CCL4_THEOR|nr:conserved hypothetical protein [Theileria orientalis strain Shintoku]BAM39597.1 conserved hypothetical protein [Theileria orientalis strain Shintoku]|eukprot:XP_009689898.1 conserved hypothetical protein [Theileria orientalis strain Shintoku]
MAGSTPLDHSSKHRRNRFDDPNPSKRSGFHDSQDVSHPQQSISGSVATNFTQGVFHGFHRDPNSSDKGAMEQNGRFHPQIVPPLQPMAAYQPFMAPGPQMPPPVHLPQPFQIPPVTQVPGGLPFPVPQFIPPPHQPSTNGVHFDKLKDKEDLDACNVGIMASVLSKLRKGEGFVPYRPLDNVVDVPNRRPSQPAQEPTLVQRNQVEDFYDELDELFQQYKEEIDPNDPKYNYSRRRKFSLNRQTAQPIKIVSPEDLINTVKRDLYTPANAPVSVTDSYGLGAKEGIGMGSNEDLFESFRRKRSSKYHETYAIRYLGQKNNCFRESVRKDPNCIVVSSGELCYSCNQVTQSIQLIRYSRPKSSVHYPYKVVHAACISSIACQYYLSPLPVNNHNV